MASEKYKCIIGHLFYRCFQKHNKFTKKLRFLVVNLLLILPPCHTIVIRCDSLSKEFVKKKVSSVVLKVEIQKILPGLFTNVVKIFNR